MFFVVQQVVKFLQPCKFPLVRRINAHNNAHSNALFSRCYGLFDNFAMSSRSIDFVAGASPGAKKNKSKEFSLCYAYPKIDTNKVQSVISDTHTDPRSLDDNYHLSNDGLYVSPEGPLTSRIVKPYRFARLGSIITESSPKQNGKLLEIAVRNVQIHPNFNGSQAPIDISAVSILFGNKVICKSSKPFNRKLYKLLIYDSSEMNNLSITVTSSCGASSTLPLPLPSHSIEDRRIEIDFSIRDGFGRIHTGTTLLTVSVKSQDHAETDKSSLYFYRINDDPNDPRNVLSVSGPKKIPQNTDINYFLLTDATLQFDVPARDNVSRAKLEESLKAPDVVVSEQPNLSINDLSLGRWFQARRPLRPSSGTNTHKVRAGREEIATITILRGVEVPVREESALVQPLVEIHWGSVSRSTSAVDGPAPVWQQTIEFEVSKHSSEQSLKLSLYDQHPVWGLQWLGDASIPLKFNRNYQQVERWIGLSPLCSPVVRFGYVQASPVRSYTRIYILMKMERPGNVVKSAEVDTLNSLSRSIQRYMATPYKISGTESPEDCAKLAMLLTPLPSHYGPLNPRQALKLNKVDEYGRAVLLATLLQGLSLDAYVLLGTSQSRKLAGFVVSFEENGTTPCLWDPENGDSYKLGDSRCSLIKASRIINHQNIWKNTQKATTVPFNLHFNPKSNKEWQMLTNNPATGAASSIREVQILDFGETVHDGVDDETTNDTHLELERHLREKLSQWRSNLALTTIYNRHAVSILRSYLSKFHSRTEVLPDKKELRQLHRAYHTRGFILNLRHSTMNELADQLFTTKIHAITGPVEFAIVCRLQKHIAKICSIWLAVVVLRDRD